MYWLRYSCLLSVVLHYLLNLLALDRFRCLLSNRYRISGCAAKCDCKISANESGNRMYLSLSPLPAEMKIFLAMISTSSTAYAGQFVHPDCGIEEQPQHDLVLEVAGLVHSIIEGPQACVGKQLGQPARTPRPHQFHLLPYGPADQVELLVGEPVLPDQPGECADDFRPFGWGWELEVLWRVMPSILLPKQLRVSRFGSSAKFPGRHASASDQRGLM
jgi:hypothetical protein